MNRVGNLGATAFLALVAGHGGVGCLEGRAWTVADAWHRPSTRDLCARPDERAHWSELTRARIHTVKDDALAVAERLLENVTWSNITSEVATALTGRELPDEPGKRFYLLRAVYLNAATGGFSVAIREDCVYVHHGCLGAFPVPMKRHALVVQLERPPKDVFVTCGMAQ